jgi:hypothetical protein
MIVKIFDTLSEENVILSDVFKAWRDSDNPAEQEGKGGAVNCLNAFFNYLEENDSEDDED